MNLGNDRVGQAQNKRHAQHFVEDGFVMSHPAVLVESFAVIGRDQHQSVPPTRSLTQSSKHGADCVVGGAEVAVVQRDEMFHVGRVEGQ